MSLPQAGGRPVIAVQPVAGRPTPQALAQMDWRWRWSVLQWAPHRLSFFLAMLVLGASALWWALVQWDRSSGAFALPMALPPSQVHAAVMTFGFIPLFFAGFLFTAGPKWLGVEPWPVAVLRAPLWLQAVGWLAWMAGALWLEGLAWAGCAAAVGGLVWATALYWRLVRRSRVEDQLHARIIGWACVLGCISLGLMGMALWAGEGAWARAWALTGLWGFVVLVYVAVAHRMIPFFTSSAVPGVQAWRPFWVLWLMVAAALFEAACVWIELWAWPPQVALAMAVVRGTLELAIGGVLLWLAWVWGLVQSLKNRLLAMLHLGFAWLGTAFVLGGVAQWWGAIGDGPVLHLAMLHALSMGCLASLMIAMVTRVSCGHGGRPLVADGWIWALFCTLQCATLLRLTAAAAPAAAFWLLPMAALVWMGVMAVWGLRLMRWYGRPRADGRAG